MQSPMIRQEKIMNKSPQYAEQWIGREVRPLPISEGGRRLPTQITDPQQIRMNLNDYDTRQHSFGSNRFADGGLATKVMDFVGDKLGNFIGDSQAGKTIVDTIGGEIQKGSTAEDIGGVAGSAIGGLIGGGIYPSLYTTNIGAKIGKDFGSDVVRDLQNPEKGMLQTITRSPFGNPTPTGMMVNLLPDSIKNWNPMPAIGDGVVDFFGFAEGGRAERPDPNRVNSLGFKVGATINDAGNNFAQKMYDRVSNTVHDAVPDFIQDRFQTDLGEWAGRKVGDPISALGYDAARSVDDAVHQNFPVSANSMKAINTGIGIGTGINNAANTIGDGIANLGNSVADFFGFAEGGTVDGYADQPEQAEYAQAAEMIRQEGGPEDTILAHINPLEAKMLSVLSNGATINQVTGLPQFGMLGDAMNTLGKYTAQNIGKDLLGKAGSTVGNWIHPQAGNMLEGVASDFGDQFGSKIDQGVKSIPSYIGNSALEAGKHTFGKNIGSKAGPYIGDKVGDYLTGDNGQGFGRVIGDRIGQDINSAIPSDLGGGGQHYQDVLSSMPGKLANDTLNHYTGGYANTVGNTINSAVDTVKGYWPFAHGGYTGK